MDFDFTAISHGYTHFSQHFPTIIFGLNKITVSVFADFANATDISHPKTQKSRPSAPSAVSRDILYSVCRHLSTYLCLYVCMYLSAMISAKAELLLPVVPLEVVLNLFLTYCLYFRFPPLILFCIYE